LLFKVDVRENVTGIIAGHIYYFFEDVLPRAPNFKSIKIFSTPYWLYASIVMNSVKIIKLIGFDCSEDVKDIMRAQPPQQNPIQGEQAQNQGPVNEQPGNEREGRAEEDPNANR